MVENGLSKKEKKEQKQKEKKVKARKHQEQFKDAPTKRSKLRMHLQDSAHSRRTTDSKGFHKAKHDSSKRGIRFRNY